MNIDKKLIKHWAMLFESEEVRKNCNESFLEYEGDEQNESIGTPHGSVENGFVLVPMWVNLNSKKWYIRFEKPCGYLARKKNSKEYCVLNPYDFIDSDLPAKHFDMLLGCVELFDEQPNLEEMFGPPENGKFRIDCNGLKDGLVDVNTVHVGQLGGGEVC